VKKKKSVNDSKTKRYQYFFISPYFKGEEDVWMYVFLPFQHMNRKIKVFFVSLGKQENSVLASRISCRRNSEKMISQKSGM